jgi:hypothetical protein
MRQENPDFVRVPHSIFVSTSLYISCWKNLMNLYYSHFPFSHPVLQLVLFDPPDLRDPGEGLLTLLPPSRLPHVQILQNR